MKKFNCEADPAKPVHLGGSSGLHTICLSSLSCAGLDCLVCLGMLVSFTWSPEECCREEWDPARLVCPPRQVLKESIPGLGLPADLLHVAGKHILS
jgi:hypothetical protein